MLPEIHLDDENYKSIINDVRNKIVSIYPKWNDFNYHDPGITLIELLAWIKESQQYFLDQIGEKNRLKYLKLLGFTLAHKNKANVVVEFDTKKSQLIQQGSRFFADNICFEIQKDILLTGNDVQSCFCIQDDKVIEYIDKERMEFINELYIYPFGKEVVDGAKFYINIAEPLKKGHNYDLYIDVFSDYPVKRNPISSNMYHLLADIKAEIFADGQWQEINIIKDTTYGLVQTGVITLDIDKVMTKTNVADIQGYYIRLVLNHSEYDVVPIINDISLNKAIAVQSRTYEQMISFNKDEILIDNSRAICTLNTYLSKKKNLIVFKKKGKKFIRVYDFLIQDNANGIDVIVDNVDETIEGINIVSCDDNVLENIVIGIGTGIPYQEIELKNSNISYEDFEIFVEDVEKDNVYVQWHKVNDFSSSGAYDCHYVLDLNRKVIEFGDCIHGIAPEGKIILVNCKDTMGLEGNIMAGALNVQQDDYSVLNKENAYGGTNEESLDECIIRIRKFLSEIECAVSFNDYERFVKKTPGLMIESCKAIAGIDMQNFGYNIEKNAIYIAVKPYNYKKNFRMTESYIDNLKIYSEYYRMIGTKIIFLNPEYVGVDVYIEVRVKAQYLNANDMLNDEIKKFFNKRSLNFGEVIVYNELYGLIDSLPFVTRIQKLYFQTKGTSIKRSSEWDIELAPNAVLALEDIKASLYMEV